MKAADVSVARPGALVIGADQVLVHGGDIIGKSSDIHEARQLLRRLSGQAHALITAAVLVQNGAVLWCHAEQAEMQMRDLSNRFLDAYLAAHAPDVLGSVGGYHFEGAGAQLFSHVAGDYFTVLGLPLLPLLAALREVGVLPS